MAFKSILMLVGAIALPTPQPGAGAAAPSKLELQRGQAIVTRDCGSCHAVGLRGRSPRAGAPTFRTLGAKYDLEGLSETLAEGIYVGHPDMPERAYPAEDVAAVIAYLQSIQPKPATKSK